MRISSLSAELGLDGRGDAEEELEEDTSDLESSSSMSVMSPSRIVEGVPHASMGLVEAVSSSS
jgi:hypothetical protein